MSDMHDHHGDPDYDYDPGYDWQGRRRPPAPRRRGLLSLAVVVAAVGSFGGLIYFVYTQGQRAGTEAVAPVIHADPGPTKVKPDQPGGMEVPNQDRLIYDRLRGDGKTDPGVERLLPPPEVPMERPKASPPPVSQPVTPEPQQPAATAPAPVSTQAAPTVLPPTVGKAAPVQAPPAPSSPTPPPATTAQPPAGAPTQLVPQQPKPVPAPVAAAPKPVEKPAVAAPVEKPLPPPPVAAGTGSVKLQFASIPSEAQAQEELQRIQRKHAAALGGLSLRLVKADLGAKGIYYRVQAGPVDEAQAKRICEAVKAAKDGCIPVH
ncbi:MAG: SPOR domain-containing protein [Azospirillaceae bacterium]|nr:SPOR domain-containing protein [Azospirillaceae bacterium]